MLTKRTRNKLLSIQRSLEPPSLHCKIVIGHFSLMKRTLGKKEDQKLITNVIIGQLLERLTGRQRIVLQQRD